MLIGGNDAIYPTPAATQAALLTGTTDVTAVTIANTGHALTFHYSQNQFHLQLSSWLSDHGFGGWAMPIGAPATGGGSAAAVHHQIQMSLGACWC